MKIFNLQNRALNSILMPFAMGSIILVIAELFELSDVCFSNAFTDKLFLLSVTLRAMLGYIFCYFFVMMTTKGKRWFNAFLSLLAVAIFHCAFSSVCELECSYIFSLLLSFVFVLCFNKISKLFSYVMIFAVALLMGYAFGFLTNELQENLIAVTSKLFKGGLLSSLFFGGVNTVFSAFGSNIFADLFFYKSIGGTLLLDSQIVTGAKELFENGYTGELVSTYLSGKYYLLFAISGLAVAVSNELRGAQKRVLLIVVVCAFLSGNISLLLLFLLLENILLFVPVVILSILSYASAALLKIGMGYQCSGGIIETLMSLNSRWIYLLTGGAVLCALGYFCGKYFVEKNGISDCMNIYIPTKFNMLLKALGGIENIIRIKENRVEVRNPQLINSLDLEYELKDNILICDSDIINELGEYLE